MLVGQQLGPFAIDKELGSGAMGAVYRGTYAKTGQRVAIKIMAPGLAANESQAARFEREAAILKQFNHPNIVRLFGIGKYHGTRYYAMEYVEGEGLDRIIGRRGKLTWEEVVDFGIQLCAALQHSHDAGVIHRDLKPSNLMILKDGKTLKLTDFGIAKDTDVTQLTSANCTVGTAAYMSPEQCRGERDLTSKSDLYSLGVLFYELLTGRKPFDAENAMEMFIKHVNEVPGRPSHQPNCLDIPGWLDTLVSQLMEKKPEQRPLNAAMVLSVLQEIREKAEAQQPAALDAAKKKLLDTPRDQRQIADADREAARTLLGGKGRLKKKRKKRSGFLGSIWFQVLGIGALLAGMVLILWLVFRPPPPEKLYAQAQKMMATHNLEEWDKAIDERGPIALYLKHYGHDRPGPETEQMRTWLNQVELAQDERLLERYVSTKKNNALKVQSNNEAEETAFKAAWDEEEGKLDDAKTKWDAMKKYDAGSGLARWGRLAAQHSQAVALALEQDQVWTKYPKKDVPELTGSAKAAYAAFLLDPKQASAKFQQLREDTAGKSGEERHWFLYAAYKVHELGKDK